MGQELLCLPPPPSVVILSLLWQRRLAWRVRAAHAAVTMARYQTREPQGPRTLNWVPSVPTHAGGSAVDFSKANETNLVVISRAFSFFWLHNHFINTYPPIPHTPTIHHSLNPPTEKNHGCTLRASFKSILKFVYFEL